MNEAQRPKVKVCGLTRPEDAALCAQLGTDFIGLIFAAKSPRRVSREEASRIIQALPKSKAEAKARPELEPAKVLAVGVILEQSLDEAASLADELGLAYCQVHGGQNPEYCRQLGPQRVIKVLWPEALSLEELQAQVDLFAPVCSYFLFDAGKSGGGAGRSFNWEKLAQINIPRPFFLAGNIGPDNAPLALTTLKEAGLSPAVLDVNSAVELAPGIKDPQRLAALFTALKP